MKIAIFGGTGRAGQLLVAQALAAGHEVVVLARTPERLDITSERLRVIRGDALDPGRVRETVAGADAVISLIGPQEDAPPLMVSRATANILAAAREVGARRVIVVSRDHVSGEARVDLRVAAAAVSASDLDWTLVRLPRLTDDRGSGADWPRFSCAWSMTARSSAKRRFSQRCNASCQTCGVALNRKFGNLRYIVAFVARIMQVTALNPYIS